MPSYRIYQTVARISVPTTGDMQHLSSQIGLLSGCYGNISSQQDHDNGKL